MACQQTAPDGAGHQKRNEASASVETYRTTARSALVVIGRLGSNVMKLLRTAHSSSLAPPATISRWYIFFARL